MKALKIGIILILVIIFNKANSQNFTSTIGFRLGGSSGLTYKTFIHENKALEGILSFRNDGMQLTALIETYSPANFQIDENIFFYYGYGAHIGYSKKYEDRNFPIGIFEPNRTIFRTRPVIGFNAIVGIEYRFNSLPISASVDTKPYTEFFGFPFFKTKLFDIGLSFRYMF